MAGLGGIIAGALGGAGAAYAESAQGELKNQQRMDLERELADVAFERDQRVKEADVMRSRSNTKYNQSEDVIKDAAMADMLKARLAAKNETEIAPDVAGAAMAKYTAGAPLAKLQRESTTEAEIDKVKTLGGSSEYLKNTAEISKALKAAEIETAKIRAEHDNRSGAGGSRLPKTETTADLDRIVKRAEADAATVMGVQKKDVNTEYARLKKRTDAASVAKLEKVQPAMDELNAASARLKNWKAPGSAASSEAPSSGPTRGPDLPPLGSSKYVTP